MKPADFLTGEIARLRAEGRRHHVNASWCVHENAQPGQWRLDRNEAAKWSQLQSRNAYLSARALYDAL